MKFTYLKGNCPVCGGERKDCRQATESQIIFCRGTDPDPGFNFLGEDRNGFGMFLEEGIANNSKSQGFTPRPKIEKPKQQPILSIDQRDRQFRQIARHSGLRKVDRQKLVERGLTDTQIDELISQGLIFSWQPRVSFPGVTPALPGLSSNGTTIGRQGYAIAIPDNEGHLLGAQIRTDEGYRWASSQNLGGNGPHLPNGEIPLGFYGDGDEINLAEGFLKPAIAAQRFSRIFIGAAGGNFASSPEQLTQYVSGKAIILNPDAGAIANRHVMRSYASTVEKLEALGCQVQVRWWGQTEKSHGDIDEISPEVFQAAKLISWNEFKAFSTVEFAPPPAPSPQSSHADAIDAEFRAAQDEQAKLGELMEAERQAQRVQNWRERTEQIQAELNGLSRQPTLSLSGRYIPSGAITLPEERGIILIDAPMGTGKTSTALKGLVDEHRSMGEWSQHLWSPRNTLSLQSGLKLGLPHHSRLAPYDDVNLRATACFESIGKLELSHLKGMPLALIDEPSQAFEQILKGDTAKGRQAFILDRMNEYFHTIRDRNGWIVLAEDGLTNLEIDFIKDLSGMEVVSHLNFEKTERVARDYSIYDSASYTWKEIQNRLEQGENIAIASDSAKWLRETERWLIDAGLVNSEEIWIVDRESAQEPWAKQLAANPDSWVGANKPRVLGWSPTLGVGFSLDDKALHFDAMAMHIVHLEPRKAKQIVERLRTEVPRFGDVKKVSAYDDDLYSSSRPEVIVRDLYRNVEGVDKLTDFANYIQRKGEILNKDNEPLDIEDVRSQIKASKDDPESEYGRYLRHWSRYKAREHFNKAAAREKLVEIWEGQGHILSIQTGNLKELTEERKEIRETLDREEAQLFAETSTNHLSLSDASLILGSQDSKRDDVMAARKRILEDKLPGCPLDAFEFVLKVVIENRGSFLKQSEMLWLSQNPELAKILDQWSWFSSFTHAANMKQIIWLPKLSTRSAQAKLFAECPLAPFVKGGVKKYDNETPEAIAVKQWAVLHSRQFKRYCRLDIKDTHTPVHIVNRLLKRLGLIAEVIHCPRTENGRKRIWAIANLKDADRELILQALTERLLKRLEDKQDKGLEEPKGDDWIAFGSNNKQIQDKIQAIQKSNTWAQVLKVVEEDQEILNEIWSELPIQEQVRLQDLHSQWQALWKTAV